MASAARYASMHWLSCHLHLTLPQETSTQNSLNEMEASLRVREGGYVAVSTPREAFLGGGATRAKGRRISLMGYSSYFIVLYFILLWASTTPYLISLTFPETYLFSSWSQDRVSSLDPHSTPHHWINEGVYKKLIVVYKDTHVLTIGEYTPAWKTSFSIKSML